VWTLREDLSDTACHGHERRTLIDVIFEKVVNHVDAQIKQCPYCEQQTKARFPTNLSGPLQHGPGIKAFVLNLLIAQMVSLNRIQKVDHNADRAGNIRGHDS
jgi:transposase